MLYDDPIGYEESGCCPTPAPEPIALYEPPAPATLPAPVAEPAPAPATTWLDQPAVAAPAPLVMEAAPISSLPVADAAPSAGAALVIHADPAASASLYPDAGAIDAMLEHARAGLGDAPAPAMPGGSLLPPPSDPSLWSSTPLPGNLFPTSDVDGDGIDNASDNAPFTTAPRRP